VSLAFAAEGATELAGDVLSKFNNGMKPLLMGSFGNGAPAHQWDPRMRKFIKRAPGLQPKQIPFGPLQGWGSGWMIS
jgi:hypothetical protein